MIYLANIIHIIKSIIFKSKSIEFLYYKYVNKKYSKFLDLKLNQKSIIIDIGANVGTVSQFIYNHFNCIIDCYEPNKYAYKILSKRFKNENKVKCYNLAVAEETTFKKIYFHKHSNLNQLAYSSASSFLKKKPNINSSKFDVVKTISINEIIKKYKIIDLIKIDIEGYEYKILPEIIKNRKKIKKVFCELHGDRKSLNSGFLNKEYKNFKKELENLNLQNNWFEEHF